MIKNVKASIVIPNLNSPIIGKTIASIYEQDFDGSKEIIVVGQDRYGILENTRDVEIIETSTPVFPATARNLGSEKAKGDILVFIDADCIALPGWLFTLMSMFETSSVAVVGGGVKLFWGNYWTTSDNISMFHDYLYTHKPGLRDLLATISLAVRRETFIEIGGFDETRPIGEDSDLSIRLRRKGYELFFQPQASVGHFPSRSSFLEMAAHHFRHGQYSIKVDPKYKDEPGLPGLFRTKIGLLIASPFIAIGSTLSIYLKTPGILSFFSTFPAVFLSKLIWCFGAAMRKNA